MRQQYRIHKLIRLVSAGAIATMLSGVASAATGDSTVTISDTGSDSHQTTTITNTNESKVTNDNDILILNVNVQKAETGKVEAKDNTTVEGGVGSGNATNNNETATDVSVNNQATGETIGGGGSGGGGGNTGGSGGGGGVTGGRGGGSALGAATGGLGGGAVLPEVGASTPMDLSALRSLFTTGNSNAGGLAAGSKGLDLGYLIPAFLLSALAGIGTVIRQKRLRLVKA